MHAGFFRKNLHNKPSASSSAQQQSTSTTDPADLDPLFEAVDPAAFKKSDLQAERLFGLENFGVSSVRCMHESDCMDPF